MLSWTGSRRRFLAGAGAAPLLLSGISRAAERGHRLAAERQAPTAPPLLEPWIDVDPAALRDNVGVLSRLAGGRPLIAVIKNNAYGLGLREVGLVLDSDARVQSLGVVKVSEALALRAVGVRKPILLLALFDDAEGADLVRQEITLSLCVPDAAARVARAAARAGRSARAQLYIDTGMSRMGLPYHAALTMVTDAARTHGLRLTGMLTELTEDPEFD